MRALKPKGVMEEASGDALSSVAAVVKGKGDGVESSNG